ncbi:MAG: hypothetical protein ACXVP0_03280 [Bacteroidia bacterium]
MVRCPILCLALSSLLLCSCAYHQFAKLPSSGERLVQQENLHSIVPPDGKAIKYKATIDVLKNHFTGLIVLKQTDADTRHLVFVTELGMRMFDFEIKGNNMSPVFVFNPLNKPKLVSALVRNFNTMLLLEWFGNTAEVRTKKGAEVLYLRQNKRNLFLTTSADHFATQQNVFSKRKKESKITYTAGYTSVHLKQYGLVKLYIELEKITE